MRITKSIFHRSVLATLLFLFAGCSALAQTRLLPLGDSITHGGQGFASYRYPLWFDLTDAGYAVDFTGRRNFTFGVDPQSALYPDYFTTFDRDHEGYWGWRTDEIADIVVAAANATVPDIVLIHLGTNDIGQLGSAGVTNADTNLRLIVDRLRSVNPNVTILLAQVIPIGMGSSYFTNADQVAPLNAVIATIASEMTTGPSPVVLIDQFGGFDLGTMMQSDGLHPNVAGERQMAGVWQTALEALLPGNPPPMVAITSPTDGQSFVAPPTISIAADATDPNGSVAEVRFFAGTTLLGTDLSSPYEYLWATPPTGNHTLTAQAVDDEGAARTSPAVEITVLPPGSGFPVTVDDAGFEQPIIADAALAQGPGVVGGWTFTGTANTFVGIFNPPAGSYPEAAGSGTPLGADGTNVAFLFNNGGAAEDVEALQILGDTLQPNSEYVLTVAIGRFLPDQPYVFSTYGGYVIELLAGSTVIASDSGTVDPPVAEFRDAVAVVSTHDLSPALLGETLSIRLDLPTDEAPRSTHFDRVRLTRYEDVPAGSLPSGANDALTLDKSGGDLLLNWSASCLAGDTDYALYEGTVGSFGAHTPRVCSTGGLTEMSFSPPPGDRYFLVVPRNASREGSHGLAGDGEERLAGSAPCLPRRLGGCLPE